MLSISGREQLTTRCSHSSQKSDIGAGLDLLEFYDLDEGVKKTWRLEVLKDFGTKAVPTERAREQHPHAKGMLLLGCRVAQEFDSPRHARLLNFPLVQLGMACLQRSRLPERNLRSVRLMNNRPAVLG